jgi:hypothetical protein
LARAETLDCGWCAGIHVCGDHEAVVFMALGSTEVQRPVSARGTFKTHGLPIPSESALAGAVHVPGEAGLAVPVHGVEAAAQEIAGSLIRTAHLQKGLSSDIGDSYMDSMARNENGELLAGVEDGAGEYF